MHVAGGGVSAVVAGVGVAVAAGGGAMLISAFVVKLLGVRSKSNELSEPEVEPVDSISCERCSRRRFC